MKKITLLFSLLSIFFYCTNTSASAISDRYETEIGHELSQSVERKWAVDDTLTSVINQKFALRLKELLKGSKYIYQIKTLKKNSINAFCIPNGHIYATDALIRFVELEDELFFVLAHEIGHQEKGHFLGSVADVITTSYDVSLNRAAVSVVNDGFSLAQELEADQYAFDLLGKTNYNLAAGALFFYRSLLATNKSESNSTHPPAIDRLQAQITAIEAHSHQALSIVYKDNFIQIEIKSYPSIELPTAAGLLLTGIISREYNTHISAR